MKVFSGNKIANPEKAGSKSGRGAKSHHKLIFQWVTDQSVACVVGGKEDLLRLSEIKERGKKLNGNPWGLKLIPNYANAKVCNWCHWLVDHSVQVEFKGKLQAQHLDAFQFGDGVVYANLQACRNAISDLPKGQQVKAEERLKALASLPKKDSYYKE